MVHGSKAGNNSSNKRYNKASANYEKAKHKARPKTSK